MILTNPVIDEISQTEIGRANTFRVRGVDAAFPGDRRNKSFQLLWQDDLP
jgi:hypothetical protein